MRRRIAGFVWNASEWSGIGLGPLAPHVFGWMIGSKPEKVQ